MRFEVNRHLYVVFIYVACLAAALSHGSPVPETESSGKETSNANESTTSTPQPVITAQLDDDVEESPDQDKTRDKARDCTIQAIQIIVSNTEGPVSEECRQILRSMTKNAAKNKEEQIDDVDLRKELKEIAQKEENYQNMNDEIDQAENLLAEKRSQPEEDLEEFNSRSDDSALLAMESEKKATSHPEDNKSNAAGYSKTPDFDSEFYTDNEKLADTNKYPNKGLEVELFQDGKFIVDDDGIGVLEEPNPSSRDSIDDDFLVIPLRFLRNEMREERLRENGFSHKMTGGNNGRKMSYGDKNEAAAKWLLQSILNMVAGEFDDKQLTKPKRNDLDVDRLEKESKSKPRPAKDTTTEDDPIATVDESKGTADVDVMDTPRQPPVKHIREMNHGVLAQVERDITKLGKDLRQLQFTNKP